MTIRVEQVVELVLKNVRLRILGQPYDELLLTTDKRYKHYRTNEDRIISKFAYFSESTTEKLVASNAAKILYQSN